MAKRPETYQYNRLGSTFMEGGIMLKVVEQSEYDYTCHGCYYARESVRANCSKHGHMCTPYLRKDKKNVIFKFIKNERNYGKA